ncbi:MFS transporter [Actinotalea sp. M2MS4P-6]|uniref:MFS transporter n=1 Tax=Actinotalea sp. M2MS4P-6 TaxID=2983762 RepID=UPI0021E4BA36|nr:MFS transporter [Actinotalea sp. M2MS4P-6]MCV2393092.1 MFS transporter [Actinotalea sp. M2MS4P-6]
MTEETTAAPAAPAVSPPRARVVVASTAGIFVESLDWSIYGLAAPYFAEQIFPGDDQTASRLGAYAVFAAGFVARPFGSFLMGRITDVRGRRAGLTASVALIALGSLIIAIAPTYTAAGLAAAGVVLLARLLQGIAMGGEVATAATYVVEVAPAERRHRYGAFAYSGDAFGTLAGTVVLAVLLGALGTAGVESGGWRLAFAFAGLCGALAFWIRRGVPESGVFTSAREAGYLPAWPQVVAHLPRMLLAFGLTIGSTMGVYFGSIYLPSFAAHSGRITEEAATAQHTVALLALVISMIVSGFLSDRFGPLALIRVGFTGAALLVLPLMLGFLAGHVPYVVAAATFTTFVGLQLGVTPVAGARLFPVPIRAVALGIPAALAIALFGGTFLFVAEWLIDADHLSLVPVYAAIGLTVSAVGSWLVRYSLLYPADTLAGTHAGTDGDATARTGAIDATGGAA